MRCCCCSVDRASSRSSSTHGACRSAPSTACSGIVAVYTLTLYPYVLLPTVAGLKAVDISVEEAAQSLGSSPARTFPDHHAADRRFPSVLSGALLVLIETFENFGVPAVLAEDMPILVGRDLQALHRRDGGQSLGGRACWAVLLIILDGVGA